jgi:hypothetical protein
MYGNARLKASQMTAIKMATTGIDVNIDFHGMSDSVGAVHELIIVYDGTMFGLKIMYTQTAHHTKLTVPENA